VKGIVDFQLPIADWKSFCRARFEIEMNFKDSQLATGNWKSAMAYGKENNRLHQAAGSRR
jgi:hypothetical protein